MSRISISKSLAGITGLGYFIAGRRTILGKLIGSILYKDVNSAMVAAFMLFKFSEVETRMGSKKFLKFMILQAIFSFSNWMLRFQGVDWLVFSLYAIHYQQVHRPRAHIMPSLVLFVTILSGSPREILSYIYLIVSGYVNFKIVNTAKFSFIDPILDFILKITKPVFSLIPAFIQSATGIGNNETHKFPYLATSSWRRQELMERMERAQMQRQQMAFNQNPLVNGIRRRAAGVAERVVVREVQINQGHLDTLVSMGFDRSRAETALRNTNNDLEQATNNLLSN